MNTNVIVMASLMSFVQNSIQGNDLSGIPIPLSNYNYKHSNLESPFDILTTNYNINSNVNNEQNILNNFLSNFINQSKNIDLEFAQIVNENFWSLLDNE